MRISILCTDAAHPVNGYLERWRKDNSESHQISIARRRDELSGGDILFLVSCSEIIRAEHRRAFAHTLVLHASDLPEGRGWSPHVWAILAGATEITLSLLEAEDRVDTGLLWRKVVIPIPTHALWDEINELLFRAEIDLIDHAVNEYATVVPVEQDPSITPTYYRKRTPADSRLDPSLPLEDLFDSIRVCDPTRFPAFFEIRGHRYKIVLEKCP